MESGKDGDRAFPVPEKYEENGMTLRDYFAAKALQGVLASRAFPNPVTSLEESEEAHLRFIGIICYKYADALLRTREG